MPTFIKNKAGLVFIILCIALLVSFLVYAVPRGIHHGVRASHGAMDLTGWHGAPVGLDGEWSIYWGELLSPEEVLAREAQTASTYIEVPGSWNRAAEASGSESRFGYATYALDVKLAAGEGASERKLALDLKGIKSAYTIWGNGKLLFRGGTVATTREGTVPEKQHRIMEVPSGGDRLKIVIQVSNFTHPRGGIVESLRLGDYGRLQTEQLKATSYSVFLAGALFIMALYHFGLFLMRHSDRAPFFFALFCFVISLRTLLADRTFIYIAFPGLHYEHAVRIEYICLAFSVIAFTFFLQRIYPNEMSATVLKATFGLSALYALMIAFAGLPTFMALLPYFQLVILVSITYALYVFILAAVRKRPGAAISLCGCFIITMTTFNDVLYNRGLIATGYYVPLGLFVFIVSQSFILGMSFSRAITHSEESAAKLALLNSSLEEKVRERTLRLEVANRLLEKQTRADGLTGIANRRHFDAESERMLAQAARERSGLALLLLDIDCFKAYNDTYGHPAGDECLRLAARSLDGLADSRGCLAARYGGEEFAIIAVGAPEDWEGLAREAVAGIRRLAIPHKTSTAGNVVTASCGMAAWDPGSSGAVPSVEQLIGEADRLLYEAKRGGRDGYRADTWRAEESDAAL